MILIPLNYLDRLSMADKDIDEDNADQANRSPICTGFCKFRLYVKIDLLENDTVNGGTIGPSTSFSISFLYLAFILLVLP